MNRIINRLGQLVLMLLIGDSSAERPGISFRFSQPDNLP
jgi:hypothetical protein